LLFTQGHSTSKFLQKIYQSVQKAKVFDTGYDKTRILLNVGNNLPVDTALIFELLKLIILKRKKEVCYTAKYISADRKSKFKNDRMKLAGWKEAKGE
jgi:hypothetical protein